MLERRWLRYSWLAATYRPQVLGPTEIDILTIFAKSDSNSAYGILKLLKLAAKGKGREKSPAYKDVHKRVKRLLELGLIYQTEDHFERGAKHYRVTPYGLIASLDKDIFIPSLGFCKEPNYDDDYGQITFNADNIIIRSLLYELLEQETISKFGELPDYFTMRIKQYLHDCCSTTIDLCERFWRGIERFKIADILPSDDMLQKYMSYLGGNKVEQKVIDEIKEYEERLQRRLDNGEVKDKELANEVGKYSDWSELTDNVPEFMSLPDRKPPYPLLKLYVFVVSNLDAMLEAKTRSFIFNFVTFVGENIKYMQSLVAEKTEQLDVDLGYLGIKGLFYIARDRRFMELLKAFKRDFDAGSEHLIDVAS